MCEEFRPLLNAYLDNELQGASLQRLENHLATCEACRAELEELRQVSNLLHALPTPQTMPVDHFVANLTLKLPRRPVTVGVWGSVRGSGGWHQPACFSSGFSCRRCSPSVEL